MPALTWMTQHRFWALGVGAMVLLVLVGAGLWLFVVRSPATQVNLRQALRLYRLEQKTGGGETNPQLPPAGVYQYRTTGGEQLSIAGISRAFPATSEMIVTETVCATMKWEPLVQHMEGMVECPQSHGGLEITSALAYEEIAGNQTTSVIHCPDRMYLVPPDWFVGDRWQSTCHSAGENVIFSGRVIGPSSVDVGGSEVPALHVRLILLFSGSASGTNPNDYWLSLQDGLVLRQRETVDVAQKTGPLGSVRYTEQMAITLTAVAPVR